MAIHGGNALHSEEMAIDPPTLMQDFRIFYNQSIHPELMHLEMRRRRLVRHLTFATIVLIGVFFLAMFINILPITLLLMTGMGVWVVQLAHRVKVFYLEFKPRIIGQILDFIDNGINYGTFSYSAEKFIPKKKFLESLIFSKADDYSGEDYICGQIREMPIELSEVRAAEFSPVRNRMNYVFKGIFLIGDFKRGDMRGKILLLPDAFRKYLSRTERAFNLKHKGKRIKDNLLKEFEDIFDTYATEDARVKSVMSEDMQLALIQYRKRTQKEIYVSIIEDKIYLAVTQDKDLMEPMLFASNVGYEVVREFYEDIQMLLSVVHDIDVNN